LLNKRTPDLILLDTDVPDMEATHLLERLQDPLAGQVPIIVITAEPPSKRLDQNRHSIRYLLKPFAVLTLLEQVGQALGGMPENKGPTAQDG
jgi:DNA-binding response OmpR family regulator